MLICTLFTIYQYIYNCYVHHYNLKSNMTFLKCMTHFGEVWNKPGGSSERSNELALNSAARGILFELTFIFCIVPKCSSV